MGLDAYIYKAKEEVFNSIMERRNEIERLHEDIEEFYLKVKDKVTEDTYYDIRRDSDQIRIYISDEEYKTFTSKSKRIDDLHNEIDVIRERNPGEELQYWRKAWAVHQYIANNFNDNTDDNCVDMPLTKDNVKQIIKAINNKSLSEEYYDIKNEFEDILDAYEDGYVIYYWAWY